MGRLKMAGHGPALVAIPISGLHYGGRRQTVKQTSIMHIAILEHRSVGSYEIDVEMMYYDLCALHVHNLVTNGSRSCSLQGVSSNGPVGQVGQAGWGWAGWALAFSRNNTAYKLVNW